MRFVVRSTRTPESFLMPRSFYARRGHLAAIASVSALFAWPAVAGAQAVPSRPKVCAEGVTKYHALSEVPTPYDTLVMPRGEPVRVHNEEEAKAAERKVLERAGSVGATGLVVVEKVEDNGMQRMVQRTTTAVFVASDTARAYDACRKGPR